MTDVAELSSAGEPALSEVEGPAVRRASSPAAHPKKPQETVARLAP